jgi:hypothetical protein
MDENMMMSYREQEAARQERLTEAGTMPPCPLCQKPRVQRSDYIRCNPCGVNWLNGEDIDKNPKVERWNQMLNAARSRGTQHSGGDQRGFAPNATDEKP